MKPILHTIIVCICLCFSTNMLSAQTTVEEDWARWADGWRQAFSKEGVKAWKPEFTFRYYAGLVSSGPMITGGVRVDDKRTFGLMLRRSDIYLDYAPGDLYTIDAGIMFRRYIHLGKRKIFALYSDLYAGCGWIYKISGKYHYPAGVENEVIDDNVGDAIFFIGWHPGIRVRCYKNLHIFVGPALGTDCLGLHLGLGF